MNSGLFFLFIVLMVIAGLVALGCFLYELITHIIVNGAPDSFECIARKYGYVKTGNGEEEENELEN